MVRWLVSCWVAGVKWDMWQTNVVIHVTGQVWMEMSLEQASLGILFITDDGFRRKQSITACQIRWMTDPIQFNWIQCKSNQFNKIHFISFEFSSVQFNLIQLKEYVVAFHNEDVILKQEAKSRYHRHRYSFMSLLPKINRSPPHTHVHVHARTHIPACIPWNIAGIQHSHVSRYNFT